MDHYWVWSVKIGSFFFFPFLALNWRSEVRFATSSMEMLPNKTRVGVGIMKVHCTETVVTDSTPTATPTTLVFNEEVMDDGGDDDDDAEEEEEECAAAVELIEKITDSPMFQRNAISNSV